MAELAAARNNALPYPIYAQPWVVVFPLLDADGDPITPSSPDSEVSKNGDTFADCTNEAVEIATSTGVCYLILTAAEMTADIVAVRIQSTGAKTTILTLYPRKLVVLSSGTCQGANDTGDIQLASGDSAIDDVYNGCIVVAVIDSTTEIRMINDYVGSTKTAEVSPAFVIAAPDSNDTYTIYMPDGMQVKQANVVGWLSTAPAAYSATRGTAGTALPAAAADAAGGLPISDAGGLDLDAKLANTNEVTAARMGTLTDWINGGRLDLIVDDILADTAEIGAAGAGLTNINLPNQTMDIVGNITGNLSGSVGSVTGAVGSVTGAVGSVTAAIVLPTIPTAWITADGIATDAFGALELAAGAASEIAAAVRSELTTELGRIDAAVTSRMATYTQPTGFLVASFPTDPADQSLVIAATDAILTAVNLRATQTSVDDLPTNAELATALGTADDALLSQVALVKTQTDKLVFTVTNQLDVNVQYVNDVQVTGVGTVASPWGPS